jgi:hypothetical protein
VVVGHASDPGVGRCRRHGSDGSHRRPGPVYRTPCLLSATLAIVAAGPALFGVSAVATGGLLAVWGFVFTAAPVAWWNVARAHRSERRRSRRGLDGRGGSDGNHAGRHDRRRRLRHGGRVPIFWTSAAILTFAAIATAAVAHGNRPATASCASCFSMASRFHPASLAQVLKRVRKP